MFPHCNTHHSLFRRAIYFLNSRNCQPLGATSPAGGSYFVPMVLYIHLTSCGQKPQWHNGKLCTPMNRTQPQILTHSGSEGYRSRLARIKERSLFVAAHRVSAARQSHHRGKWLCPHFGLFFLGKAQKNVGIKSLHARLI